MESGIHVSLTPENINLFGLSISNSFFTMIVVMVLLVILMLSALARPKLVPGRWQAFWELLVESMLNTVENSMGRTRTARMLFPLVATLFIFILFANWFSILPGIGTIGYPEVEVSSAGDKVTVSSATRYALLVSDTSTYQGANTSSPIPNKGLKSGEAVRIERVENGFAEIELISEKVFTNDAKAWDKAKEEIKPEEGGVRGFVPVGALQAGKLQSLIVPLFRPPNADLNMTLAMALIAVITANVVAISLHGLGGWIKEFFPKPYVLDILLTPIEIVGQFARVASLTFRLFGNIFAGEALLAVILTIAAPALVIFLAIEMFFGFIQALVFASLTTAYLTLAAIGLGEDEGHGHSGEDHADEQGHHEAGDMLTKYPSESTAKEREAVGTM